MEIKELKEELVKVATDIQSLLEEIETENVKVAAELEEEVGKLKKQASEHSIDLNMGSIGSLPSQGENVFLNFILS